MGTKEQSKAERLAQQRKSLPDSPGVYLFHDERDKVIYVGKAKSLRKRVASHFTKASNRASLEMTRQVASVDFVVTQTEAEALLAEQEFIKRHRPLFNVRLRDDKSYPYIAISLDEEYPRVYFTREKHRRGRAYFGPFSNAKRVRSTLDLLGKVFQYRTCDGKEPGRATGSPCLDYYIKRCQAPCVGYVVEGGLPREHRGDRRLPLGPLPRDRARTRSGDEGGRRGAGVRAGGDAAKPAARGAVPARTPANLQRGGRDPRRDRGRRARRTRRTPRSSRSATACSRIVRASISRTPGAATRPRSPSSSRCSTTGRPRPSPSGDRPGGYRAPCRTRRGAR